MCNDASEDTKAFTKLYKIDSDNIEGESRNMLEESLIISSTWILIQTKTILDVQKKLCPSPEIIMKTLKRFSLRWKETNILLPVGYFRIRGIKLD